MSLNEKKIIASYSVSHDFKYNQSTSDCYKQLKRSVETVRMYRCRSILINIILEFILSIALKNHMLKIITFININISI